MSLALLQERIAAVNDVLCAASVLNWDARTMMPVGGAQTRGCQIAALARVGRDMLCAEATFHALDAATVEVEAWPANDPARRLVEATRHALDVHGRIPADLIERRAALQPVAEAAWVEARARSDFSIFAPLLEKTFALTREFAEAVGYEQHPCDALIGIFEPGETVASLARLFGALADGLKPVLAKAMARPKPRRDFLKRNFPEASQRTVAVRFAERFGYDLSRGRLDPTVHPFEISFTRNDVRITTRYRADDMTESLFSTMHEVGHGLYEQNIDPLYTRTVFATDLVALYAMGGASFGAHESQSRLWENHVGRSHAFWRLHFDEIRREFPEALADVDADAFYAAVTHAEPGFIRTEADELTYDFHILLRIELEAALMGGELAVADIPAAWNAAVKRHLGLDVPDDAHGCLQDVHWASGMIGGFCSYTIGNIMAAQLMQAVERDPTVGPAIERGEYAPLRNWLSENIWRHGRRFTRDELLVRATGRALDPAPYLAYLGKKYGPA